MLPEAVKRRNTSLGCKNAIVKGMSKRKNPFVQTTGAKSKHTHSFSVNVSNNEPVSKKAGRTMVSKTKFMTARSEVVKKSAKNEKVQKHS